jgi:hypothetical protein
MINNIVQKPSPNLLGQPVVNFELNDFESAVWNKGYEVIHEQMIKCPCKQNLNEGNFLSDCSNCQGSGYVYLNPSRTRMILHSMNYNTKYKEWSEEKIGTVSVTSMQRDRLSFMDRITVVDSSAVQSELLILKLYGSTKFLYTIYDITSIIDIFTFSDSVSPLRKLNEGVDFVYERNKVIILTNDAIGKVFSVRYNHNSQYHIVDLVHDVRNSPKFDSNKLNVEIFPVNAIARRSHYILSALNFEGNNIIDNSY